MTVLEAWAYGKPIIGSNRGGIAEWVAEYGGGVLFSPGDVHDLARCIRSFCKNRSLQVPEGVRTMSDVAREMLTVYWH